MIIKSRTFLKGLSLIAVITLIIILPQLAGGAVKNSKTEVSKTEVSKTEVPKVIVPVDPNKKLSCGYTLAEVTQKINKIRAQVEGKYPENEINQMLIKVAIDYGTTLEDVNNLRAQEETVVTAAESTEQTPTHSAGNAPASPKTLFTPANGASEIYTIEKRFIFTNTGTSNGDIKTDIYLPYNSSTAFQNPLTETVTADHEADITFNNDDFGITIAHVKASGISPGASLNVVVKLAVQTEWFALKIKGDVLTGNVDGVSSVYLKPEIGIESDSPAIKNEASSLKKSSNGIWDLVLKTHQYVYTSMTYDESLKDPYDNKGALSVLTHHIGVCEDFADLEVALLRANNIPARVDHGYGLDQSGLLGLPPDTDLGNGWYQIDKKWHHAWVEIYLDPYGWVPADPTYAQIYPVYQTVGNMLAGEHILQTFDVNQSAHWEDYGSPFDKAVKVESISMGNNV